MIRRSRRIVNESVAEQSDLISDVIQSLSQQIKRMDPIGWVRTNRWIEGVHFGCDFKNNYTENDLTIHFDFKVEYDYRTDYETIYIRSYNVTVELDDRHNELYSLTSDYLADRINEVIPRWNDRVSVDSNIENILSYVEFALNAMYDLSDRELRRLRF